MGFGQKRKQDKLYKQWIKHGDLSREVIPQKERPQPAPVGRERNGRSFGLLYLLLGVSIIILCVGLVLIFIYGC